MFRIGTTSYVVPDDMLANATHLAPLVDDVELVLFDTADYGSNFPDPDLCACLADLASQHSLTYTVHLPLDLRPADDGSLDHASLRQARRAIESTQVLSPYAYIAHLDGTPLFHDNTEATLAAWRERSFLALDAVACWLDDPALLCLENVERWDPEAFAPLLDALPISRCIDVGHLWLEHSDPMAVLPRWLDRARVVHLHGMADRDHSSLARVPAALVDPVVDALRRQFSGVVTLEVFDQDDLRTSLEALAASLERQGGPRLLNKAPHTAGRAKIS